MTLLLGLIPSLLWAQAGSGSRVRSGEVRFLGENEQGCEEYLWLKDSSVMVRVPDGTFMMGSPDGDDDERPVHQVYLDAYYMDKHEVTNRQYKQFCDATGRSYPDDPGWAGMSRYFMSYPSYPVVNVSWEDATAYCAWAGKRLPTEAEWEEAARSTFSRRHPWGSGAPTGASCNFADRNTDYGWSEKNADDGYARTAPVGSFPAGASPYGCLDMAGNVWEWCSDWYDANYYCGSSASSNPQGRPSGSVRVLRGGSWYSIAADLRCAYRSSGVPSGRTDDVGFRGAVPAAEQQRSAESGESEGAASGRQSKAGAPLLPGPARQTGSAAVPVVPFEEVEVKPRSVKVPVPTYPDMARSAGIEGQVVVEALVDVDGSVADARILKPSGNASLDRAALDAALSAKFTPGRHKRSPVRVWVSIPFRFTLQ